MSVRAACAHLEPILRGPARRGIVDAVADAPNLAHALQRMRDGMRSHTWHIDGRRISLQSVIQALDRRTRKDGFHALHDWDGKADRINDDIIPVDVLNYLIDKRGSEPPDRAALAILLDYYFLHLLALLSLNLWEDGDADEHCACLNRLLADLQGQDGSGQKFARTAGTLLLLATSHYELHEPGFDALLARVRTLDAAHQFDVALVHAPSLGSHLRFGYEATYGKSPTAMRDDNVVDYPWLCFALATLAARYSHLYDTDVHGRERETIVEAMLNALTPDAPAFLDPDAPPLLARCDAERSVLRDRLYAHRDALLDEFAALEPPEAGYSPISLFFNFSQNVLKGTVIDALLWGEPWDLALDDLLTGLPRDDPKNPSKAALARTLMGYARANPDRIRGRLRPVIVYDPRAGRRAFFATMRQLKDVGGRTSRGGT